jgi:hypothetical protein
MVWRTMACLRRVKVTIPQLSPTHTSAQIVKFCIPDSNNLHHNEEATSAVTCTPTTATTTQRWLECYDPLFVLRCSPDVVTPGYRLHDVGHCPLMIVEAHDEGIFKIADGIVLDEWYDVGHVIGEIDDGDDVDADDDEDDDHNRVWLWQAHYHTEGDGQTKAT